MEPGFYCMDCMEAMKQFPDGFFDLAIVDPPYGISITSRHKAPVLVGGVQDRSEVGVSVTGRSVRKQTPTDKPSWNFYRNPAGQTFITRSTIAPRRTRGIFRS